MDWSSPLMLAVTEVITGTEVANQFPIVSLGSEDLSFKFQTRISSFPEGLRGLVAQGVYISKIIRSHPSLNCEDWATEVREINITKKH